MKLKEKLSFIGIDSKRFQIRLSFGDTDEEQTKRLNRDRFDVLRVRIFFPPFRSNLYAQFSEQGFPLQFLT